MKKITLFAVVIAASFTACKKDNDHYDPKNPEGPNNPPAIEANVLKAVGDNASITATVNQFREILGSQLNTEPGKTSGRREVNWDAVPASFTNNNNFPLDFFNLTDPAGPNGRKRGMIFLETGTPIRIDSSNFAEIEPSYAQQIAPFSPVRTLIAANSTVSEIAFKVPGAATDASVKGFGIIFTDVDNGNYSGLEFYNGNKKLGTYKAPGRSGAGEFSFLGVHFPGEKVTRVKIFSGNAVLAPGVKDVSDGGTYDIVAFDDFFYDEPQALN